MTTAVGGMTGDLPDINALERALRAWFPELVYWQVEIVHDGRIGNLRITVELEFYDSDHTRKTAHQLRARLCDGKVPIPGTAMALVLYEAAGAKYTVNWEPANPTTTLELRHGCRLSGELVRDTAARSQTMNKGKKNAYVCKVCGLTGDLPDINALERALRAWFPELVYWQVEIVHGRIGNLRITVELEFYDSDHTRKTAHQLRARLCDGKVPIPGTAMALVLYEAAGAKYTVNWEPANPTTTLELRHGCRLSGELVRA